MSVLPLGFDALFSFVQVHGYFIIYLLMVIEGPIVNSAASFAASLGFFNIFLVWLIAVAGDLTGDIIYYFIGKFGHEYVVKKAMKYFKINSKTINQLQKNLRNHAKKTIVAIKFAPIIAGPGLIFVGASKVPFKQYIVVSILTIIPITSFFSITGYYFGRASDLITHYFNIGGYTFLFFILFLVLAYFAYKFLAAKISKVVGYLE